MEGLFRVGESRNGDRDKSSLGFVPPGHVFFYKDDLLIRTCLNFPESFRKRRKGELRGRVTP